MIVDIDFFKHLVNVVFRALLLVLVIFVIYRILVLGRVGTVNFYGMKIDRDDNPIIFWSIFLMAFIGIILIMLWLFDV